MKNLQDSKNALFGNNNNNNFNNNNNNNDNANSEEYNEYEYESDYDQGQGQGQGQGDENSNKDGERFLGNSPPAPNTGSRGVGGRDRGQVTNLYILSSNLTFSN